MKKILLTTISLTALFSFSQKKMVYEVEHNYSDAVTLSSIDSTAYDYVWNMGVISSHELKFSIFGDAPVYLWQYQHPNLDYTTRSIYGAANYPLNLNWSSTKTYNATNLCTSDEGTGYRDLYTYTTNNLLATETSESETSPGVWEVLERHEFYYDALDRIVKHVYFDGGVGYNTSIDSAYYDGTTENIAIYKHFESNDGINFNIIEQSDTYWTSGNPDYVNYFEDDDNNPTTPIVWSLQGNYTFSGSNCTSFKVHPVAMGMPQVSVVAQWDYTYGGNSKLASEVQSGGFGNYENYFTYDSDGLLTTVDRRTDDGNGMYTEQFIEYGYESVAGIEEKTIEVIVYPNPATDYLIVPVSNENISIYSMGGNLMMTHNGGEKVDISRLRPGVYLLATSLGKVTFTKQ